MSDNRAASAEPQVRTAKFAVGQEVVLSEEGRSEIPSLRNKVGVVLEVEPHNVPNTYRIEWRSRKRRIWINHGDNICELPQQQEATRG